MIKDNRQFIDKLESSGDLVKVKPEVDWDLEAGEGCSLIAPGQLTGPEKRIYPRGYPSVRFILMS